VILPGFGMAAHPGDSHGMQCPPSAPQKARPTVTSDAPSNARSVKVAVAAAVEPMANSLATTGFQRGGAGEGGERGLAADSATVRPTDQQLGGDDRPDPGSASSAGPAGCCRINVAS
jgi:hypothetical protein